MHPLASKLTDRACQGAAGADYEAEDREHRHESTVKVHNPMVRFLSREAVAMIALIEGGDSGCKGRGS